MVSWHIVRGSRGATCHVKNDSNMSSNGTHKRHVATCEWVKIHGRWIRDKGNPKVANKDWPCGNERTSSLDQIGREKRRGEGENRNRKVRENRRDFRARVSTFSLYFSTIGLSNPSESRGKVDPHCKSYTWVPVLWSFDKLQEVGVFSYLV